MSVSRRLNRVIDMAPGTAWGCQRSELPVLRNAQQWPRRVLPALPGAVASGNSARNFSAANIRSPDFGRGRAVRHSGPAVLPPGSTGRRAVRSTRRPDTTRCSGRSAFADANGCGEGFAVAQAVQRAHQGTCRVNIGGSRVGHAHGDAEPDPGSTEISDRELNADPKSNAPRRAARKRDCQTDSPYHSSTNGDHQTNSPCHPATNRYRQTRAPRLAGAAGNSVD